MTFLLTERSGILLQSLLQKKHLSTPLLWCSRYKFNHTKNLLSNNLHSFNRLSKCKLNVTCAFRCNNTIYHVQVLTGYLTHGVFCLAGKYSGSSWIQVSWTDVRVNVWNPLLDCSPKNWKGYLSVHTTDMALKVRKKRWITKPCFCN